MKSLVTLALLLTIATAPALAQVAAPSLLPGSMTLPDPEMFGDLATGNVDPGPVAQSTFVPDNPAALQWSANSDVGLGMIDNALEYQGPVTDSGSYDGQFAGARVVWPYVSLAVTSAGWQGQSNTMADTDMGLTQWAAAFQLFDVIALGVGEHKQTSKFLFVPSGATIEAERTLPTQGVSLRLGGLHLGYRTGEETLEIFNVSNGAGGQVKRKVSARGIAWASEGENAFHIEYYRTKRGYDFEPIFQIVADEEVESVGVIEARFGGFVLGVSNRSATFKRHDLGTAEYKQKTTTFDVAWVTGGGWTVNGHMDKTRLTRADTAVERTIDTKTLALGYRF